LFGGLVWFFGLWSLTFWTPFLAVVAVLAWRAIIEEFFDHRVGFYSTLLLMAVPAWWYWSARPLMPNVLFVSFLIFSVFFLVVKKWPSLAGLALAGALWIRTAEIFWLAPLLFLIFIFWREKIFWRPVLCFLASLAIALLPMFFVNHALYGSYLATGYTAISSEVNLVADEGVAESGHSSLVQTFDEFLSSILPFGFHPRAALRNFWNYGLVMNWWLVLPAVIGAILAARRGFKWRYLLFLLVIGVLVIVYGSAVIHDNPDPAAITIGNSYSRYWLPLFVATTPLAALAISRLRKNLRIFCLIIFFLLSFNLVFFSSADALWPSRQRLIEVGAIRERVLALTESEAVVIVDRADKLFFPDRRVRFPLRDETTYALMAPLAKAGPLYYFGITFPQVDLDYLNNEKLKSDGLVVELVEIFNEESLYQIRFSD
jgi:hypothetical protein